MTQYLIRRILLMVPTLVGITAMVFFVMAITPGGIGASLLNAEQGMRPEERRALEAYYKARYDLDKPLYVQYCKWLNRVSPIGFRVWRDDDPEVIAADSKDAATRAQLIASGLSPRAADDAAKKNDALPNTGQTRFDRPAFKRPDLGESFGRHRPVSDVILEALPITLLLELISLPLIYGIAIWSGITAARHRGKSVDVGIGTLLIALWSMPEIWIGVMMIGFLTNRVRYVHWFPSNGLHDVLADSMPFLPSWSTGTFNRGWLLDLLWHLALPLICISYGSFAFLSRLQRGALLDSLSQDFVRTARAKGLKERAVLYRHAFRTSLMPLITVAANILPGMIAGAVIVETIFGIQGMGKLFIDAAFARDRELLLSLTLIGSLLQLVGFLLADVTYAIADPRVSYVD